LSCGEFNDHTSYHSNLVHACFSFSVCAYVKCAAISVARLQRPLSRAAALAVAKCVSISFPG